MSRVFRFVRLALEPPTAVFRGALLVAMLCLGACSDGGQAAYDTALKELAALETQVDVGFDAAKARHGEILGEDAWQRPSALAAALQGASEAMGRVVADQKARIGRETTMLDLKAMDNAPKTRELYHLDIESQQAKLAIFQIFQEMYTQLLARVRADDPSGFAELTRVYLEGIGAANRRYVELDAARQLRQEALLGEAPV